MCLFVKQISDEYTQYKAQEDNMLLFGGQLEIEDIKNAEPAMRVVPVTREEFLMLENQAFLNFLKTFGISKVN